MVKQIATSLSFTITFSEDVTGFSSGDISVSNGSVSNFVEETSSRVWSFDLLPSDGGTVLLDVAAGALQDTAGNDNAAVTTFSFVYHQGGSGGWRIFQLKNKEPENVNKTLDTAITFTDIEGHFAYDAIMNLYNLGIVKGRSDDKFEPDAFMTRAEILKIVVLALKKEGLDLNPDSDPWYADLVSYALDNEIATGYADGDFAPDKYVSRAEAVKMILKATALSCEEGGKMAYFVDVKPIDWFFGFVQCAYSQGLIKGRDEKTFAPNDFMTRGEAAVVVNRYLEK